MSKERPILFNTAMVQAILENRKGATRRLIKLHPGEDAHKSDDGMALHAVHMEYGVAVERTITPPYKPGDVLWVRETWMCETEQGVPTGGYIYRATDYPEPDGGLPLKWRPSIFMPREAARLFLRVTNVWPEKLRAITDKQAIKEGAVYRERVGLGLESGWNMGGLPHPQYLQRSSRMAFAALWNSTIKRKDEPRFGWGANPWVWAIQFERISEEVAHGQM